MPTTTKTAKTKKTATTKKTAAPKTAKTKSSKAPVKKGTPTKKSTHKSETTGTNGNKSGKLGSAQIRALQALSTKGTKLTRNQIGEAADIKSGFCGILGHFSPEKVEPQSLVGRGLVRVRTVEAENGSGLNVYEITAAGIKALKAAK